MYSKINKISFFIFIITSIILPYESFGIKIFFALFLLIFNMNVILNLLKFKKYKIISFFIFLFIPVNIVIGIISGATVSSIASQLLFPMLLPLVVIAIEKKIEVKNYILISLSIVCIITVFSYVADVIGVYDIYNNNFLMWFHYSGNAMIGKGSHTAFYYMIFFKTSPLIFILLFHAMKNDKKILIIVAAFGIFVSGTRANVLLLAIVFPTYIFLRSNNFIKIVISIICLLICIVLGGDIFAYLISVFEGKANSDMVRSGHLIGILESFNNAPFSLILGQGIGTTFYSYGTFNQIVSCELSYFNIIRQFGIVGLLFISYIFSNIMIQCYKKKKYDTLAFLIIFLITTYTNPFIWSTTGIVVLIYCTSQIELKQFRRIL